MYERILNKRTYYVDPDGNTWMTIETMAEILGEDTNMVYNFVNFTLRHQMDIEANSALVELEEDNIITVYSLDVYGTCVAEL